MTIGSQTLRSLESSVLQSRILQTLRLINSLIFAILHFTVTDSAAAKGLCRHFALLSLAQPRQGFSLAQITYVIFRQLNELCRN